MIMRLLCTIYRLTFRKLNRTIDGCLKFKSRCVMRNFVFHQLNYTTSWARVNWKGNHLMISRDVISCSEIAFNCCRHIASSQMRLSLKRKTRSLRNNLASLTSYIIRVLCQAKNNDILIALSKNLTTTFPRLFNVHESLEASNAAQFLESSLLWFVSSRRLSCECASVTFTRRET